MLDRLALGPEKEKRMAGEALFIGWGGVVRGREKQALQVFQESMEYYGKQQQDGRIERFGVLLLGPHGGRRPPDTRRDQVQRRVRRVGSTK
jgi:hypothetical protein